MDLFTFIIIAIVYIMIIHFALGISNQFNLFLMIAFFIFGGAIGYWLSSFEFGLVIGIILSLLFF